MRRGYRSFLPLHLIAVRDRRRIATPDYYPPVFAVTSKVPMSEKMKEDLNRAAELIMQNKPTWVVIPVGVDVKRI